MRNPPVGWLTSPTHDDPSARVVYRGAQDRRWTMRYGFDGWQQPIGQVQMEETDPGVYVSEPIMVDGHVAVDFACNDQEQWDNNSGADFRLWVRFQPIDSHLHVSGRGPGELGIGSLRTAMASAGVRAGVCSWVDNRSLECLPLEEAGLYPLVWVRPGVTDPAEVQRRLDNGFVGLKLHPTTDDYRADDPSLDPYLEAVASVGLPVACHCAPGGADPDHIRSLAERFPQVPVIMYHTFLGPDEGRRRAARHALEQPNLYLETSWCRSGIVLEVLDLVGPDRVIFGSDASIDGKHHYNRQPPNVDGAETYFEVLLALARNLDDETLHKVTADTTAGLFRLGSAADAL